MHEADFIEKLPCIAEIIHFDLLALPAGGCEPQVGFQLMKESLRPVCAFSTPAAAAGFVSEPAMNEGLGQLPCTFSKSSSDRTTNIQREHLPHENSSFLLVFLSLG